MSWFRSQLFRRLLIVPPILVGVAVVAMMVRSREAPPRLPPAEEARALRVIEVPSINVVPRVLGYGSVRPAQVWQAVIEVGGRITLLHPKLRAGEFLQEGEIALRIDQREFELAVAQLKAELNELTASIDELNTQIQNTRELLVIEEASLTLAEAEFERLRLLAEEDNAAPTELRNAERTALTQQRIVQDLRNSNRLNQKKIDTLEARRVVTETRLDQRRLDLEKTTLRVPFDCRVQDVSLELNQYLQPGQRLFEADGIAVSEVDVQVPMEAVRNLVANLDLPRNFVPDMEVFKAAANITARVRLSGSRRSSDWEGRFVRIREQFDPITRAAQFVVAVDRPYQKIDPGERPPLMRGAYCEVELRAKASGPYVVVPRASIVDGAVYTLDESNRLKRQTIDPLFEQSDFVCIEEGLAAGTRIVVSDPRPAVEGQLVEPHAADDVLARLIAQATAETSIR
ncbi:MAG: efflux RND transporter periplasmic adaptor subunit [Phycisphaerae bacterium]